MGTSKTIAATVIGFTVASASLWTAAEDIADLIEQPGTPSKQPEPKNPLPGPKNPTPRPADPTPDPNSPGAPNNPPNRPADKQGEKERGTNRERSIRPFAFQSPDMEGRFNQSTRRLAVMEQRMQKSNEDLLKRLGEARQLSGERQSNALMDVIQQLLKEQGELQRYLIQARIGWAGDADLDETPAEPDREAQAPSDR